MWVIFEMNTSALARILKTKETRYSAIIAQTILYSKEFRTFLEDKAAFKKKNDKKPYVQTEKNLPGYGRIDIYIEYDSNYIIALENKINAALGDSQLSQYEEYLEKTGKGYSLLLLKPSTYSGGGQIPKNCHILDYKEIIEWIEQALENVSKQSFEAVYMEELLEYLREVEMKPFSGEDMKTLAGATYVMRKTKQIIGVLKKGGKEKQEGTLHHLLLHGKVKEFSIYRGFRFGPIGNYYDEPLLKDSPECIVYVKDTWKGDEGEKKNDMIKEVHSGLKNEFGEKIYYYPRITMRESKANECRLAIRRSLKDFINKDAGELVKWFDEVRDRLESEIKRKAKI